MRKPNPAVRPEDARAAWDAAQSSAASAPVTVRCKLMTPMYGGGVEPGEVDCAMPIRPSAIRGQLRFWWRLLNGVGLRPQDVFAAESDLWGGIATTGPRASRVAVDVAAEPVGSAATVKAGHHRFPAYAFILERDDDPTLLGDGYEFMLTLRFAGRVTDARREQVIEALRWWASFGGIGARTRRGLGTVKISGGDVRLKPVTCKEVESRGGRMVLRGARKSAIEAWKDALEALKNFRQGESLGRNRGGGQHPGRSRWPEPDAIRHVTGDHAPGHEPKRPVVGQYPRAAFGLPIVFQFKNKNQGDPKGPKGKGLTLNAAPVNTESNKKLRRDRMASPLILRPYFDGARYQPLALLLPGWESHVSVPVALDSTHLGPAWPEDSRERERLADLVPPMQGRGTDALTAFLHYFEHPAPTGGGQGGR